MNSKFDGSLEADMGMQMAAEQLLDERDQAQGTAGRLAQLCHVLEAKVCRDENWRRTIVVFANLIIPHNNPPSSVGGSRKDDLRIF